MWDESLLKQEWIKWPSGKVIKGRWKKNTYRILRLLGSGENGMVYLAVRGEMQVAMKVGRDPASISLEWERMQEFKRGGEAVCPKVYEIDDYEDHGTVFSYYVMEYIEGMNLRQYVTVHGKTALPFALFHAAQLLHAVHLMGYGYCDLKPENVLVNALDSRPVLIDFGGVTPFGIGVKEFTEIYDRAFWGCGLRKADPHYDFFALALMGVFICSPFSAREKDEWMKLSPDQRRVMLLSRLQKEKEKFPLYAALLPIITGKILDYEGFSSLLRQVLRGEHKQLRQVRVTWDRTDWGLLFSVLIFASVLVSILILGGHTSGMSIQ